MATVYTRASKGSALTWAEGDANINNLNSAKLENIVEDTTPQLGGNLDIQSRKINTSATNGIIELEQNGSGHIYANNRLRTGIIANNYSGVDPTGASLELGVSSLTLEIEGQSSGINISSTSAGIISTAVSVTSTSGNVAISAGTGRVTIEGMTFPNTNGTDGYVLTTNGLGTLSWTAATGLSDIVNDLTPQLGGNLDVNGKQIISVSNGDIDLAPNGTGKVKLDGVYWPAAAGTSGQVLAMDGTTQTTWTTLSFLTDIVNDTTPQLGGSLDVNGQKIVSVSNGNIELEPNGTGDVLLTADTVRVGDSAATATITTNGAGNLVLNTNSGTNSGTITITQGANANIIIEPNGTGDVLLTTDSVKIGDSNANATLTTNGTGDLILNTNDGTNSGSITIQDAANGNILVTPNGTGMTMLNNIEYHEKINALGTTSGTVAPDVANGNVQTITLNGNLTLNAFTNPIAGQSLTLIINTNGTGRTLSSTMKFAGGSKTLSTTNTTDIISVFYDGTNYWASLSKGFV